MNVLYTLEYRDGKLEYSIQWQSSLVEQGGGYKTSTGTTILSRTCLDSGNGYRMYIRGNMESMNSDIDISYRCAGQCLGISNSLESFNRLRLS